MIVTKDEIVETALKQCSKLGRRITWYDVILGFGYRYDEVESVKQIGLSSNRISGILRCSPKIDSKRESANRVTFAPADEVK